MKIHIGILALFSHAVAFTVKPAPKASPVVLKSMPPSSPWSGGASLPSSSAYDELGMFPLDLQPTERIEGGNTIRTYKLPLESERLQYVVSSNGRPLKAQVQLWLGPLRNTHTLSIDSEDGRMTPVRATLKFKKGNPTLRITTTAGQEFPAIVGFRQCSDERNEELAAITQKVWDSAEKVLVQGGAIDPPGGGAVRIIPVPANVKAVQVLLWSTNTGKKSLKAKIEVLHGPNNPKQTYDLQCGGGSQPYHAIFQTPGENSQIRIINKKFVEDGLFEVAVVPYTMPDSSGMSSNPNRQWWE